MERLLTATVERDGTGPVLLCGNTLDELSLSHDGNQLRRVTDQCAGLAYEGAMDFRDGADAATEYTYDACGNMTSDCNKGVHSVSYNVLNLPEEVRFDDGHVTRYTWAADGRKLRVEYLLTSMAALEPVVGPPGTIARVQSAGLAMPGDDGEKTDVPAYVTLLVRDYCGNHVYRGGRLERVLNGVGYSDSAGYHYCVRDYRGDVRAVVADDGTLEEVNHYYPYGMLHGPSAIAAGVQPHKYTGKELDREAGLDLYDFAARQLDPALGRTTTQDPMAEKYYSISPYAWCASNPIKHVDPTGKESINGINMNEKNAKNVIPGLLNKYQNTNKIVVFSHGNETGTALVYSVKKMASGMPVYTKNYISTAKGFKKYVLSTSKIWRSTQKTKHKGVVIVLNSCYVGRPNGFAQKMSKAFPGVTFIAPTKKLYGDNKLGKGSTWVTYRDGKAIKFFK